MGTRYRIIAVSGTCMSGKATLISGLVKLIPKLRYIWPKSERLQRSCCFGTDRGHVESGQPEALYQRGFMAMCQNPGGFWRGVLLSEINEALKDSEHLHVVTLAPDVLKVWHELSGDKILFLYLASLPTKEVAMRMLEKGCSDRDIDAMKIKLHNESSWDLQIATLVAAGIPIKCMPRTTVEETLFNAIQMIYG